MSATAATTQKLRPVESTQTWTAGWLGEVEDSESSANLEMPKKSGTAMTNYADRELCVEIYGVGQGDYVVTPLGVQVRPFSVDNLLFRRPTRAEGVKGYVMRTLPGDRNHLKEDIVGFFWTDCDCIGSCLYACPAIAGSLDIRQVV